MTHAEPGIYLGPVGLDDVDDIVPQANSPEKIVLTVDAIADGCSTSREIAEALGVDPRQGAYYATAARHLGLVDRAGPGHWTLTTEGVAAAQSSTEDLVRLLDKRLDMNPHLAIYADGGEEALLAEWSARGDIGPETMARRAATIRSWAEYRTADDAVRLARLVACRSEVGDRLVVLRSRPRPVASRRSVHAPERKRCQVCGIDLPWANTSGVCENCS
jgi:hypothetical protein